MKMNFMDYLAWVLVVVGGLNWGLVGAFKYNLVDEIFGVESGAARTIYVIVGLAAIYTLFAVMMKAGSKKAR